MQRNTDEMYFIFILCLGYTKSVIETAVRRRLDQVRYHRTCMRAQVMIKDDKYRPSTIDRATVSQYFKRMKWDETTGDFARMVDYALELNGNAKSSRNFVGMPKGSGLNLKDHHFQYDTDELTLKNRMHNQDWPGKNELNSITKQYNIY